MVKSLCCVSIISGLILSVMSGVLMIIMMQLHRKKVLLIKRSR